MPRTLYFKFRGERENGDRLKPETMDSEYSDPLPNPFGFNEARSGEDFTGGPPAKPLVELEMTQLSAELRLAGRGISPIEAHGRITYRYGFTGGPFVKPLVELEMTRLSAELRRKSSWWTKCRHDTILSKWREEALVQAQHMDESHINYVLNELDGYANLRDETSGAEVSCYDKIWQSDTLIPAALKERLIAGAVKLENVPESERDWHPRSNGQVLDLVHPSLYPIVYGRTLSYPEDFDDRSSTALQLRLKPPADESSGWLALNGYYISERFQWLPTDFEVSEDGLSVKRVSYINNLNPIEHEGLYRAIEGLIGAYIPLFERVLTDSILENEATPERTSNGYSYDLKAYRSHPNCSDYSDGEKFNRDCAEWEDGRSIILPYIQDGGYKAGSLEKRRIKYKLGGRTIQVIVKLANIHLTPEKPEYSGGSWHVEGMKNEAIAASGIYYYDEENITESRLAFRTAVGVPPNYEQGDEKGCMLTWGMKRDDPCVNELGSVITCQDHGTASTSGMARIRDQC
ncbi:hypothetical protein RSAG8_11655, partial [Rhizoctonia solani AG-8 WAC10335]